ncbi:ABC transporter substrate-binding protein [Geomonas azotofigens]|uniref:ABC transporter substrate-binding protein n=1 Tax=Geomonas azotofigens TaxID=2843196 RepID=UPI001C111327|nr:hypothetical protein [Geomonas azotofigens]MBU5614748.1 hypothetical protein [Geomonas azotofigens]
MTRMWPLNRLLYVLVGVCLLGWVMNADGADTTARKKVLILNSYHSGYKGSDDAVEGIRETLLRALPETEIQIEYLDSKNNSGKEFDGKLIDLLRFKYQKRHFDLILSTDDYAFSVIEAHGADLFGATPVVFCGTNSFDRSRLTGKHGIVGIDERPSFKATLDLILTLHPKTSNIVVIRDDSVTGQLNDMEFRKAAEQLRDRVTFSDWAGLRMDEFITRVEKLHPGSVIVYFASFVQDENGDRVSSNEALRRISTASPVPVYGGWEFNLGKGIVGGRLLNLREHGAAAAALAVRVLRGESIDALPPVSPSPNKDMFDYNELRRFGIAQGELPADSIIVNKPPGYLWSHRVEILSTISVLLLLALTMSFVKLVNSRKNLQIHRDALMQRNEELEKALSKVKVLEGIIPVCMYCKKVRKDEQSWQQMESYISQHTEAQFSHGICPTCFDDNFSGKKPKQL